MNERMNEHTQKHEQKAASMISPYIDYGKRDLIFLLQKEFNCKQQAQQPSVQKREFSGKAGQMRKKRKRKKKLSMQRKKKRKEEKKKRKKKKERAKERRVQSYPWG